MMTTKRYISLLLVTLFYILLFPNEMIVTEVSAASTSSVESLLRKGFDNFDTEIKITTELKDNNQSTIDAYIDNLFMANQKLMLEKKYFYVEDHIETKDGYIYYDRKKKKYIADITAVKKYIMPKGKLKEYKSKFSKKLNKMISGVDENWTDVQKAAYLHDQLVLNTTYLDNNGSRYTSTPYSALVDGKALCAGYARTYAVLLNEVGIDNKYVYGDATNNTGTEPHAWNLVKIKKRWYHVDCTYDDADTTINGESYPHHVRHEYFLKSDQQLQLHSNYNPKGLAKSTIYDKMNWDSYSQFSFFGKEILYFNEGTIYSINTNTNKIKKLLSMTDKWEIRWTEYYTNYYSNNWVVIEENCSTMAPYDRYIYYNLAHAVYKYEPKTGKVTAVYSNSKSDSMIIGIYISNKKLYGTFVDRNGDKKDYLIKKL